MDQTNMPIGIKFAVIHRAFRREMDALLRQKDLTGAQFGTLRALDCLEKNGSGEISQRQLEEVCHSAHPTMTEILKKLEKKGFIETRPSETDHRRKAIRQTDRARELRLAMSRVDEETFEKFCTGMSEEQTKSLGEMLDRLMKNACSCAKEEERE